MKKLKIIIGWGASLGLLYLLARQVPLAELIDAVRYINPWKVLLASLVVLVSLALRSSRWAALFMLPQKVKGAQVLPALSIGLALNAFMPGKMGEVGRIIIVVRRFSLSIAHVTATVVGERLLDALTLLFFIGGSLVLMPTGNAMEALSFGGHSITVADIFRSLGAGALVLFAAVVVLGSPAPIGRVAARLPYIGLRSESFINNLQHGFSVFRSPRAVAVTGAQSLLIWLLMGVNVLIVSWGVEGLELSFMEALVVMSVSIGAAAVPLVPGSWGIFEAAAIFSMKLMSVDCPPGVAIAFALVLHLSQYLPVVLAGLFFMAYSPVAIDKDEIEKVRAEVKR